MSKSPRASLRRCMRPEAPIQPGERIDLAGALLLPAFVDGHIHLDKTHWGAPRLPHVEGRSVRERIAAERVERHRVALPIEARASALIRTLIANGTTRARSHIDIDNDVGLANLEAVLRVREAYRDWIDIQLVAFPQSGVTTEKGAPDLMAAAISAGADLIGGLDPAGFDGDVKGQLDIIFGLAEQVRQGNRHSSARRRRDRRFGAPRHRRADDRRRHARPRCGQPRVRARSHRARPVRKDRRRARPRGSRDHDVMPAIGARAAGPASSARAA